MLNVVQLYLCGLPVKKLEKLRRLVNTAGGLRFNQPSEELTHVVMGELDQDLKNFLSKATHRSELQRSPLFIVLIACNRNYNCCHLCVLPPRPHVVTVQWLLDTFTKGSLCPESGYLHPDCLPPAAASVSVPAHRTSTSRASLGPPVASPSTPRQKRADEDLLSQYMDDDPTIGMHV